MKIKVGQVIKTERYYLFWGIISAAVVLGQLYVGLGYRIMAESIFELIDTQSRPELSSSAIH